MHTFALVESVSFFARKLMKTSIEVTNKPSLTWPELAAKAMPIPNAAFLMRCDGATAKLCLEIADGRMVAKPTWLQLAERSVSAENAAFIMGCHVATAKDNLTKASRLLKSDRHFGLLKMAALEAGASYRWVKLPKMRSGTEMDVVPFAHKDHVYFHSMRTEFYPARKELMKSDDDLHPFECKCLGLFEELVLAAQSTTSAR
jgi:hypothetical protein